MSHWTHKLEIELPDTPDNRIIKADCEFNNDGIASFQVTDYDGEGVTLPQHHLITQFIDLSKRIYEAFDGFVNLKIKKIP